MWNQHWEIPVLANGIKACVLLCSLLWSGLAVPAEEQTGLYVASPQAGAQIRSGTVPVLVRVPVDMRFHTADLYLDGQSLSWVPTVVRRRWWEGKGVDLIASFPTGDLADGWHTLRVVLHPPEADDGLNREVMEVERRFRFKPRGGRLAVRVVDQRGNPRSARIDVFDQDGSAVSIGNKQDANGDPSLRDIPRHGFFVGPGGAVEFLKPGVYTLLASGGVRDGVERRVLSIQGQTQLTFTVPRLFETPDEVSADLHVHTAMSSDAFVPDTERFQALSASGIDVAVVTEHNRVRDPRPAVEMLGLGAMVSTISGAEVRVGKAKHSIGHVNAFPLRVDGTLPKNGDAPPAEVIGNLRRAHADSPPDGSTGPLLVQLNHPRGIQFYPDKQIRIDAHALFEEIGFDPSVPLDEHSDERVRARDPVSGQSMLDFDAIEVLNRFSVEGWMRVRKDWFALLNRGHRITGTGNADSHTAQLERVGFPMNLVKKGDGSIDDFLGSIATGKVRVSSGPLVELVVADGGVEFRPSHDLVPMKKQVSVRIRVSAAPWVPVPEVRLIQNGSVIFSAEVGELGPDMSREWEVPVVAATDCWLIAEAGWPLGDETRPTGVYADVAPGHVPIGFTNPVWLDVDSDRVWGPIEVPVGLVPQ